MSNSRTSVHTRLLEAIAPLIAAQFGVISRRQLNDAGVPQTTIARWVSDRLLHRIHPGVYALGHGTLTRQARWMAAQLWAGDDGCLGYWTAAMLHNLTLWTDHRPHVVVPPERSARNDELRIHRSSLRKQDLTEIGPFRVTTWEHTIADTADIATERQLKTLIDATIEQELFDKQLIEEAIDQARGRHGLKRLIPVIATLHDLPDTYRSMTERRMRDELILLGLPAPEVNAKIPKGDGTYVELDLLWRRHRVNAELDGPHHEFPFQKAADAERDAWLAGRRIRVERFPVKGLRAAKVAAVIGPLLIASAPP
jgi:hypothetical protein